MLLCYVCLRRGPPAEFGDRCARHPVVGGIVTDRGVFAGLFAAAFLIGQAMANHSPATPRLSIPLPVNWSAVGECGGGEYGVTPAPGSAFGAFDLQPGLAVFGAPGFSARARKTAPGAGALPKQSATPGETQVRAGVDTNFKTRG